MSSSNQVVPSKTPATYGLSTPSMRASGYRCRSACTAGVAMTASPTQFGRKTATRIRALQLLVLGRFHPLQHACRRQPVMQRGQVHPSAVSFDKIAADDLVLLVIGPLDQDVRPDRPDQL